MVNHHPANTRLVGNRVQQVAQEVRANVLLGDVIADERKQRIEPHQIRFVLRNQVPHSVGKLLTRLDGLSDDRKAPLQGRGCLLCGFYSQPTQRALKHFRNVSKIIFGLNQKRLQRLVESGKLRAVRLGRVLRIREADYEAFLENNLV